MPNRSHFNAGHRMMNRLRREGVKHSSDVTYEVPDKTYHAIYVKDVVDFVRRLPSHSVQLIVCDPPYNIELAHWDKFSDYMQWARLWLDEVPRLLTETGNFVIFGGLQYQSSKGGDLLDVMAYLRGKGDLRLVNLIVWYYKNGMSAHRFFANRHEEIAWYTKSSSYVFNLDAVRIPFDDETKRLYLKDRRLRPESIEKGKNPTNVWEISRLNANSEERVGHPTQKPSELVRRLVRGLSYPGSIVLDFFAGSAVTAKVCIEEQRYSILSDNDPTLHRYLQTQLTRLNTPVSCPYKILSDTQVNELPHWGPLRNGSNKVPVSD